MTQKIQNTIEKYSKRLLRCARNDNIKCDDIVIFLFYKEATFGFASLRLMAFSLNRVQLIGNVTRVAEVKMAGSQKVATFGVATNLTWKDQTGAKKEKAEFHNIVAWRRLAEICEQYLRKGSKVYIEGRLQTRDWEGEDGVKRYKTEIVLENMIMLDKKGDAVTNPGSYQETPGDFSSSFQAPRAQKSIKPAQEESQPEEQEVSIDDLPF